MAVTFILGRAGSGKTRYCVDALGRALAQDPRHGPRLILLVPEQASLQTERTLLSRPELHGLQRGEVLSFRRFAQRLLQTQPVQSGRLLTRVGRAMLLQQIAAAHRDQLQYFKTERFLPGLYQQLSDQIEEFVCSGVRPDALQLDPAPAEHQALALKLADLQLLYRHYLERLDQGFVDPVRALDQARACLPQVCWLDGARVWVDGFASFTGQEARFLTDLALRVADVEITLLLDATATAAPDPHGLFSTIERTYQRLQQRFRSAGIPLTPPVTLTRAVAASDGRPPDLDHLEAHLFERPAPSGPPGTHITLHQAVDPRAELRTVAAHIIHLTRRSDQPLRYRDIAVITRQVDDLHDLIAATLREHDIPYFVDRKPPLREHAIGNLLSTLLDAAAEQFSLDTVRRLLKSDLLGMATRHTDRLENYILAHGISGLQRWIQGPWQHDPFFGSPLDEPPDPAALLTRINEHRLVLLQRLDPWIAEPHLKPDHLAPGLDWARRLYQTLERLDVWGQLDTWAEQAAQAGRTAEAEHHRQAWLSVVQLFDDFEASLGDSTMTLTDFRAAFEAGLAQLDTGLVPPAIDQLLVASIERSRHPDIRVAFVIGMNDGWFPRARREPQLLNDEDREVLEGLDLELQPPRRAHLAQEQLLCYIACTRPRDHLVISYCRSGLDGAPLEPSPYIADLQALFPTLTVEVHDNSPAARIAEVHTAQQLARLLAMTLRTAADRSIWNTLYDRARREPALSDTLQRALRSLSDRNHATLPPGTLMPADGQPLCTSVTALETHAHCPFKYFAERQLRLQDRPTAEPDALLRGSLAHAVLDDLTRTLIAAGQRIGDLTDPAIDAAIERSMGRLQQRAGLRPLIQSYLWQRLGSELQTALRAQRTFQAAGRARTLASELAFGLAAGTPDDTAPAIDWITPKTRRVRLRGRIDRVDRIDMDTGPGVLVYDYKLTTAKALPLGEVYHGLLLQLPVYLEVAAALQVTAGRPTPAGAFFFPLVPDYERIDHPRKIPAASTKPFRPRGIFATEALPALDADLTEGYSTVVSAFMTKRGEVSRPKSDAVPQHDLQRLLSFVKRSVLAICDRIADGTIEVRPYRLGNDMPCSFCRHRPVCRFEFPETPIRQLPRVSDHDFWAQLDNNA